MVFRSARTPVASGAVTLLLLLLPTHLPSAMEYGADAAVRAVRSAAAPRLRVLRGNIARNSSLQAMLSTSVTPGVLQHLVDTARPAYDLARLSVGHPFDLTVRPDGLVAAFNYGIDELRTLKVTRDGDALRAEVVTRDWDTRVHTARGVIRSSLFGAVEDAGEQDQLAIDLSEIFRWDVDFNTELQKGDSFRVAVEKNYVDGRFCRYGRILSAELVRGERTLRAVRFEDGDRTGYFTPDGTPMRRTFLRSPVKFTRISSGFTTARLHPILNYVRPHLGVDFAAPTGTPVMASANGVVVLAGRSGGYGNLIRLRHAMGFETLYGHLSRIRVRVGQRVEQGEVIGAVGMTGLATGPHLDYRTVQNGVFLNPMRVQSPPAEPIRAASRAAFGSACQSLLALLDQAHQPPVQLASR